MHQYYDLIDMLRIPRQVIKELIASQTVDKSTNSGETEFQLGLCTAIGFGVKTDYKETIQLFSLSATKGYWKARILISGVAAALAIDLDPGIESHIHQWTDEARGIPNRRSLMCNPPRGLGFVSLRSKSTIEEVIKPVTSLSAPQDGRLLETLKSGRYGNFEDLIRGGVDVNFQGEAGETALHYAVLLPGTETVDLLLQKRANVLLCTAKECEITTNKLHENHIPPNVSPLVLAVLVDRVSILDLFLTAGGNEANQTKTIIDLLAWGAQYQSLDCVRYLCDKFLFEPTPLFDYLGSTPISYAVRSDFLYRLTQYTPGKDDTPIGALPVIDRQLKIVECFLKAGHLLQTDDSTSLNCLHIAAASSDVALLNLLLRYCKTYDLVALNKMSPDGFSPLGIAITRGREASFDTLVNAGASLSNAWPEIRGHALHCCAMYPSPAATTIAKFILKRDRKAVHARDKDGRTPLHCAAFREHNEMVELLIEAGADIAVRDADDYTPLGAAVTARSIRAIKQICAALKLQRLPLVSWSFSEPIFYTSLLTYSPMEQLLSPGTVSPARAPEMSLEDNQIGSFGCCDFPFSQPSMKVLGVLLESYQHRTRFGTNLIEHIVTPKENYSGIHSAISMGNFDAVELILKSKKFHHDIRYLILCAHNQRTVGSSHVADETTRERMLDYLEDYHDADFKTRRQKRRASLFFALWMPYYACYGDLEHAQFQRASTWLRNNRHLTYRPPFLEFTRWDRTRFSINIVSFCIGWTLRYRKTLI